MKSWFGRRGVRVYIQCPHGDFIPSVFWMGRKTAKYSCDECKFVVALVDHKGKIDW